MVLWTSCLWLVNVVIQQFAIPQSQQDNDNKTWHYPMLCSLPSPSQDDQAAFHWVCWRIRKRRVGLIRDLSDMKCVCVCNYPRDWPEIFFIPHLHTSGSQHGQPFLVLQPQRGLQEFERLAGILLIHRLDLCLKAGDHSQHRESIREMNWTEHIFKTQLKTANNTDSEASEVFIFQTILWLEMSNVTYVVLFVNAGYSIYAFHMHMFSICLYNIYHMVKDLQHTAMEVFLWILY